MGYVTLGTGYESWSWLLHLVVPLCITYSIIKGQVLLYDAYMVWEVKDLLSRKKCRLRLSPSHLIHHITTMI